MLEMRDVDCFYGEAQVLRWRLAPFALLAQAPIHVPSVPLLFLALGLWQLWDVLR